MFKKILFPVVVAISLFGAAFVLATDQDRDPLGAASGTGKSVRPTERVGHTLANDREALQRWLSLLRDPDPRMRMEAVRKLGWIADGEILAALKAMLVEEQDARVAKLARKVVDRLERKAAKGGGTPRLQLKGE